MYTLDSLPHVDCSLAQGPGERDINCGICLEAKGTHANTIVHTVCFNSFHSSCFDEWSKSCRNQHLHVSCPSCRAVLVNVEDLDGDSDIEMTDLDDGQDEPAEHSGPGLIPDEMADEPLDTFYWRVYSSIRDELLQDATRSGRRNLGPVYSFVADDAALQAHMYYEQVCSRSLADAVAYRYFMDRQSRQTLWYVATQFGVDSFRCYRAPAGTAVDYILAPDYLDRYTQGVRSVRDYQPIPALILDLQRQIVELTRPDVEMRTLI